MVKYSPKVIILSRVIKKYLKLFEGRKNVDFFFLLNCVSRVIILFRVIQKYSNFKIN